MGGDKSQCEKYWEGREEYLSVTTDFFFPSTITQGISCTSSGEIPIMLYS